MDPCERTVSVVLGAQWGDEGKGKLIDILAADVDLVARCQGGSNAGHTIVVGDTSYAFHLLPSGLINPKTTALIGNGVVVHPPTLFKELDDLEAKGIDYRGRLFISSRAHIVFDLHRLVDQLKETELGDLSLGTTKSGIGPTYAAKATRSGLRVHHLFDDPEYFAFQLRRLVDHRKKRYGDFKYDVEKELQLHREMSERLKPMVVDSVKFLHEEYLKQGKRVLVEGANAALLDIDFGTYPFVTSSNATIGGVFTGLGFAPRYLRETIGVVKAYMTRVGSGPFPTELTDELGEKMQEIGHEYGTTTGRRRRCGWLDMVLLRYSQDLNGFDSLCLTKLDVLDSFETIRIGVAYKDQPNTTLIRDNTDVEYIELPGWQTPTVGTRAWCDLPKNARLYVEKIEELVRVPVKWIGTGPGRDHTIVR